MYYQNEPRFNGIEFNRVYSRDNLPDETKGM